MAAPQKMFDVERWIFPAWMLQVGLVWESSQIIIASLPALRTGPGKARRRYLVGHAHPR